jgi:signal peptidase I
MEEAGGGSGGLEKQSEEPPESATGRLPLPKMAIAGVALGFFSAILTLAAAVEQVAYVLVAILPIAAAVSILRRRAWGGYGFALLLTSQSLLAAVLLPLAQIAGNLIFGFLLALLFFLAGRALDRVGAASGLRWPWIGVTAALTVPLLFVRAYSMPSGSMENTLLIGDRMLVRVFPRPLPARGDLIVFHYPLDQKQVFIKRVIGIPGDRVRMKDRATYLNGRELKEPYVIRTMPAEALRDNLPGVPDAMPGELPARTEMLKDHLVNGELVVPPGKYFVLGDNRDNSFDSRYWGFVDASNLIGEPFLIYDSEMGSDTDLQVGTGKRGGTHVRWERIFKGL